MSMNLSFRERLEQPVPALAADPPPSGSPAHAILRRVAALDRPVSIAETLRNLGLGLRNAHTILNRLAADEDVVVTIPAVPDRAAAGAALRSLGIEVEWRQAPVAVDVKAIRERLGLTQASFAARFGLELDSVRNWEQGRYSPDPIARTLLKVIEQSPEAVDKAVAA